MASHTWIVRKRRLARTFLGVLALGLLLLLVARFSANGDGNLPEGVPPPQHQYAAAHIALLERLQAAGYLRTEPVIRAMALVQRHLFVPPEARSQAYLDYPLPIGLEQTISAPSIVALMTELIQPGPEKIVLEVGTGSGYQAAVLAKLCRHVYSIEILEPLADRSAKLLKALGYENITVRCGDGYQGWPEYQPFDGIMVTCAPDEVPSPLVEQLKEGWRMVIPVGEAYNQQLYVLQKTDGKIEQTAVVPVVFVPMTGEARRGQ